MENTQPEPSMEEILASIRRIISEDEEETSAEGEAAKTGASAASTAAPESPKSSSPKSSSAPSPSEAENAPEEPAPDAATVESQTKDVDMTAQTTAQPVDLIEDEGEDPIVDDATAAVASQAFDALSQNVKVQAGDGRSLEDLVVAMLRPMVKDWLDANLPAIVEEKVEEEVRRLARRRR